MISIPDAIRVGGFDYEVRRSDAELLAVSHDNGAAALAYSDHRRCVILLPSNPDVNQDELRASLFHELIHAILRRFNPAWDGHDMNEETVCDVVSAGLVALEKDNPELFCGTEVEAQEELLKADHWGMLNGAPTLPTP